jgi:hypothetical protein
MGRGGFSSVGNSPDGGTSTPNDNNNKNDERMYYRGGFFRMYYYIPLDNTYVIFQMIATIIIFIIAGIVFLTTYKSPVVDPIEDTKRTIMNSYIIIVLLLLCFTLLSNYFSKDKFALTKRLIIILSLSVIAILVFFGIKVNLDSTYTSNKFAQIYEQEYSEETSNTKSKIDIGLNGVNLKSEKEYYVDKCLAAYKVFSIKMYGIMGLNIFLMILLIYQIFKVLNIQEKRDRLSKDDAILFDEEENIKM